MPVAAWPVSLPSRPLRSSWSPGAPEGMQTERDMEDGPPLARRKRLGAWTPVQPTLRLTAAQLDVFEAFWRADIAYGADVFDMPVWTGSAYETRRCKAAKWTARPATGSDVYLTIELRVRDL